MPDLIWEIEDNEGVFLTFDDGPTPGVTEWILATLKRYDAKATFFVVGEWVDKYPDSVQQLHEAGHEIMNHSNSHPHMTELSIEKMKEEVNKCDEKIMAITGVKPTLFRAPYGDYNNAVVGAMRETGHFTIQWDVDSLDWKNLSSDEICKRVTQRVKPGSIVLFHNAALNTPDALPPIIECLQKEGYKIVPVSKIIMKENFTVDPSGMQIPVNEKKSDEKPDESEKKNPTALSA